MLPEVLAAEQKAVQRDPKDQGFQANLAAYQKALEEHQRKDATADLLRNK
jgi:hypothetical protein